MFLFCSFVALLCPLNSPPPFINGRVHTYVVGAMLSIESSQLKYSHILLADAAAAAVLINDSFANSH